MINYKKLAFMSFLSINSIAALAYSDIEQDSIFSLKSSHEFLGKKNQAHKTDKEYRVCLIDWPKTRVLSDFYACVGTSTLVETMIDNGEMEVSNTKDIYQNSTIVLTSSSTLENSSRATIRSNSENMPYETEFSFNTKPDKTVSNNKLELKRMLVNHYGIPTKITIDSTLEKTFIWDNSDGIQIKVYSKNDKYFINYIINSRKSLLSSTTLIGQ
jgi:hypothetical protein